MNFGQTHDYSLMLSSFYILLTTSVFCHELIFDQVLRLRWLRWFNAGFSMSLPGVTISFVEDVCAYLYAVPPSLKTEAIWMPYTPQRSEQETPDDYDALPD